MRWVKWIGFLLLVSCFLAPASSYGRPEHFELKSKTHKARESQAQANLKNVKVSAIQDPEARRAIQEILNYLGVSTQ